jgi:ABC-type nitrate/sulfonate/bicarbonate transport system substrate-binding protein
MRRLAAVIFGIAMALVATVSSAQAPGAARPLTVLRVLAFDGGWNLPLWVAGRNGLFDAQGLSVQLAYTPNSGFLVKSVLEGKADLAFAAIDNVIAYQEGQGEAAIPANPDLFAFMGGDGGFISLVAAPDVRNVPDLKGRKVSVDAMTTGFAFVVRELVARNGVAESDVTFERAGGTANRYKDLIAGKHDATLLRTPFELLAGNRGFHTIATAETLGPYQGTVGLARRSFARDHAQALVAFLKAYKAATDWIYDPANREIAQAILVAHIRDMTPALAKASYDLLVAPQGGLSKDLKPDAAGIRTVLQLRSKYATPPKALDDPMKYVDLAYYEQAFGK